MLFGAPRPRPQGRAERVESEEAQPPHAADAGDDPVDLPEHFDEARAKPTLSPMTAAAKPMTPTATTLSLPAPA
jgi:hypothetical protein